jgi:hypothetical protein
LGTGGSEWSRFPDSPLMYVFTVRPVTPDISVTSRHGVLLQTYPHHHYPRVDLAEVGLKHSSQIDDFVQIIRSEVAALPEQTMAVVFPPSTPAEGNGLPKDVELKKRLTEAATETFYERLKEQENQFVITKVHYLVDEKTCYSKSRDLKGEFWTVFSNERRPGTKRTVAGDIKEEPMGTGEQEKNTVDNGDYKCMFAKSFLVRRGAVNQVLVTLGRHSRSPTWVLGVVQSLWHQFRCSPRCSSNMVSEPLRETHVK